MANECVMESVDKDCSKSFASRLLHRALNDRKKTTGEITKPKLSIFVPDQMKAAAPDIPKVERKQLVGAGKE